MGEKRPDLVRWSKHEWDIIARRALELEVEHPRWQPGHTLREAQKALPPSRQKKGVLAVGTVASDAYKTARRKVIAEIQAAEAKLEAPPPPTPELPEPPDLLSGDFNYGEPARLAAAEAPAKVPEPPPSYEPARPRVGASVMEVVAGQIGETIKLAIRAVLTDPEVLDIFKHAVLDVLTHPAPNPPVKADNPPAEPPVKEEPPKPVGPTVAPKPRVMVVGLLGQQAESVSKGFTQDMDLRFYGSDTQPRRLTEIASNSDYALVMTKFIGHPAEDAVRRGSPADFRRVNGGPTDLMRVLDSVKVDWRVRQTRPPIERS